LLSYAKEGGYYITNPYWHEKDERKKKEKERRKKKGDDEFWLFQLSVSELPCTQRCIHEYSVNC